jgi:unsaturated rhamnogalacturonyl hydrolase
MIRVKVPECRARLTRLAVALVALGSGCASRPASIPVQPSPEPLIRQVADAVLRDFPQPPPFNWGEGTMMAGMMRAGLVLDEPRYIAFVEKWADHWRASGLEQVLEGPPDAKMRAYCGIWGPGFPVALLYEKTGNPVYLQMCRQIAEFVTTRGTRTPEGGLGHWGGNHQLWADTLYMVCPLFTHLTRLTSDPAYLNEAVRQLEICARHAQDEKTGVFWHMYDDDLGKCVGVLWGRGNGWVTMSFVEVLGNLDRRSPKHAILQKQFGRQMDGLLAMQDPQAFLWHTVLDRPETYLETSASAMILVSLVDAQRLDLYQVRDKQLIPRTWAALAAKVDTNGRVFDVSGGTGPQTLEVYASKPRGTYTWGTGAFLLAASALQEAR